MLKFIPFYFFLLLFISPISYSSVHGQSQERITIERTDSLRGFTIDGLRVNRLFGNVRLRDRERVFVSDSAYLFPDIDKFQAWGNLQITGSKDIIWANELRYTAQNDLAELIGQVVISQDSLSLQSEYARYNFDTEIAEFPEKIQLNDKRSILIADGGLFFSNADSALFVGNIQLADSSSYLEGDTLRYNRLSREYWISGSIFGKSEPDSIQFSGSMIYGDSTGYKRIVGDAIIEKIANAESDSSFYTAQIIEYFRENDSYSVKATGEATLWSREYAARADSVWFNKASNLAELLGLARIWKDRLELSGNRLEIYLSDSLVDSIKAFSDPFIVMEDSLHGRLHQLSGEMIEMYFDSTGIRTIEIPRNTQLLYFPLNDNDEADGAIRVQVQSISLRFEDNEIVDIIGFESPDGQYFEESDQVAQLRLDGFTYTPELKPNRPEIRPEPRLNKPDLDQMLIVLPRKYRLYLDSIKP
jgi:hypothetical protein